MAVRYERTGQFPNLQDSLIADTTAELILETPDTETASGTALDTGISWIYTAGNGWKEGILA